MPNIVCSGPGPHVPANGILGTTTSSVPVDMRCGAAACVKPVDPATTNRTSIEQQAATALGTNATYLALQSRTNAQVAAQVESLTRQNNRIIRLLLGQFDSDS